MANFIQLWVAGPDDPSSSMAANIERSIAVGSGVVYWTKDGRRTGGPAGPAAAA